MVGYNRRFAPLTQIIKNTFNKGPMAIVYRINAGMIPAGSWIQDSEIGGGRIIGEVCHFVDFLTYIIGSTPISVYAASMKDNMAFDDIINVSLSYKDGSIGTICYFSNGGKSLPKEKAEIFTDGYTAVLDDFKTLTIYANNKKKIKKLINQNKGQKNEVDQFIAAVQSGRTELIPFDEIYNTSLVTFKIVESIRIGKCLKI
jgi:predicted dehydrogenase